MAVGTSTWLVAALVLVAVSHLALGDGQAGAAEEVVVDAGGVAGTAGGGRRENPAFAKSLAHLRSENSRLEAELAALREEVARTVGLRHVH